MMKEKALLRNTLHLDLKIWQNLLSELKCSVWDLCTCKPWRNLCERFSENSLPLTSSPQFPLVSVCFIQDSKLDSRLCPRGLLAPCTYSVRALGTTEWRICLCISFVSCLDQLLEGGATFYYPLQCLACCLVRGRHLVPHLPELLILFGTGIVRTGMGKIELTQPVPTILSV